MSNDKCSLIVGIDWSGSRDYARGADGEHPIQIAVCTTADRKLSLIQPTEVHNPNWQENRWSRTTAGRWLLEQAKAATSSERLLIGLDHSFSMPYADKGCYFPREPTPTTSWLELLQRMQTHTGEDYSPEPFVTHQFYQRFFKRPNFEGTDYEARLRITEQPGYLRGLYPANAYKLIGGDQVGKGAISGMSLLMRLRDELGSRLHIWPFDGVEWTDEATAIIVESWPRLLYELIGVPPNSHRYPLVFRLAMEQCGIQNPTIHPTGENTGDALMTAAALLQLQNNESIWSAPQQFAPTDYQREGWIWGAKRA